MRTLLPCLILFLCYLICERIALNRALRRIPLRIAVTGTRGKSTVTRMLASILKEDGRRVVAKTTGSQAMILLPDGGQLELDRSVTPSILEQAHLVRKAARLRADCLVAEVMSIHPENHFVESRHILKPNLVAITNVRRDHTETMGETEDEIASVLSLDICAQSTAFVPEREDRESFRAEALRCNAALTRIASGASAWLRLDAPDLDRLEFTDTLDLVCAVANHLGISREKIIAGIRNAHHDIGRLRVWRYHPGSSTQTCYLVNAFAANDPESTFKVLARVTETVPAAAGGIIGILNLRADRLPRTVQWMAALKNGGLNRFNRLFVTGDHAGIVRRRVPGVRVLKGGLPQEMMRVVCSEAPDHSVIFGFGNIKGSGRRLVDHWGEIGEQHGI
jgi:poly-gamma-glutamate synthase PgsB/CapB